MFGFDLLKPVLASIALAKDECLEQRVQIGIGRQSVVTTTTKREKTAENRAKVTVKKVARRSVAIPMNSKNEESLEPQWLKAFFAFVRVIAAFVFRPI